jgi:DNA (cytosine-5)-methyltransferase 1
VADLRIGSACSGYGGLDLAALALFPDAHVAWHAEYNPDAAKILERHWPGVPNLHDLTAVDWDTVEPVDILTAGYPCQPFSHAGRRQGETDARHLWPHIAAAIRALRPRIVLLENVLGHLTLGFGTVLGDLAAQGFDAEWVVLRASDVGAPHGRARVFIAAADASDVGHERGRPARDRRSGPTDRDRAPSDASSARLGEQPGSTPTEETRPRASHEPAGDRRPRAAVEWGPYTPAIRRWERILGRPAPRPTDAAIATAARMRAYCDIWGEDGYTALEMIRSRRYGARLSPRFVEWLMGLPDGWVTAVPGLSRNAQLTALGNGVVPQQTEAAYRMLLPHLERAKAAA